MYLGNVRKCKVRAHGQIRQQKREALCVGKAPCCLGHVTCLPPSFAARGVGGGGNGILSDRTKAARLSHSNTTADNFMIIELNRFVL
jgi:hypothetical protein